MTPVKAFATKKESLITFMYMFTKWNYFMLPHKMLILEKFSNNLHLCQLVKY